MRDAGAAAGVDADVVVVGGGLIGAAAALGVADRGFRVLLLETSRPAIQRGRMGMDLRSLALSPGSRSLLDRLGVWGRFDAAPYRRMDVWEERGTRRMEFDAADVRREELGWIVENSLAVDALWRRLEAHPEVSVRTGAVLESLRLLDDRAVLNLAQGAVSARLVIAADGARSRVRELLDLEAEVVETGHHALATLIRTQRPHQGVAYQRFLLDGPLALLPSTDPHVSSVVWSQSPERAAERAALAPDDLRREIERCSEAVLGVVEQVDQTLVFPVRQLLARRFDPRPRALVIGDAAHVVHPLAGLGANLGLEDVRDLLNRFGTLPKGADAGAPGLWQPFARQRRVRARLLLQLMRTLKQIYASSDPTVGWLRNTGVGWLNRAGPVKRQIVREALGLGPLAGPW